MRRKTYMDLTGEYDLIETKGEQYPFEIGSLEREALSNLGPWAKHKRPDEPFGLYHRLGMKEGLLDAEGDLVTLFLHFTAPFTKKGTAINDKIKGIIEERINKLMHKTAIRASQMCGNAACVRIQPPPNYMLAELVELTGL